MFDVGLEQHLSPLYVQWKMTKWNDKASSIFLESLELNFEIFIYY